MINIFFKFFLNKHIIYNNYITGQPGYPGPKGEKGISIKGAQGYPGISGYFTVYLISEQFNY